MTTLSAPDTSRGQGDALRGPPETGAFVPMRCNPDLRPLLASVSSFTVPARHRAGASPPTCMVGAGCWEATKLPSLRNGSGFGFRKYGSAGGLPDPPADARRCRLAVGCWPMSPAGHGRARSAGARPPVVARVRPARATTGGLRPADRWTLMQRAVSLPLYAHGRTRAAFVAPLCGRLVTATSERAQGGDVVAALAGSYKGGRHRDRVRPISTEFGQPHGRTKTRNPPRARCGARSFRGILRRPGWRSWRFGIRLVLTTYVGLMGC